MVGFLVILNLHCTIIKDRNRTGSSTLYRSLLQSLLYSLNRSDQQLIQRTQAGLLFTAACLDITSYSEFHARSDHQTVPLEAGGIQFKLSSWRTVGTILSLIGRVELVFVPALGNKFRSFV